MERSVGATLHIPPRVSYVYTSMYTAYNVNANFMRNPGVSVVLKYDPDARS